MFPNQRNGVQENVRGNHDDGFRKHTKQRVKNATKRMETLSAEPPDPSMGISVPSRPTKESLNYSVAAVS